MDGTEARDELYQLNKERLAQIAWRVLDRGMKPSDFVVIAIDADDSAWIEVVNQLLPDHDWDQYRQKGLKPVARGWVNIDFVDYLKYAVPSIAFALEEDIQTGAARAVVLASGGASVYIIKPEPQYKLN